MKMKNRYKSMLPERAVISITDRCNSRCSFCNIWQTEKPSDLNIELIYKLPSTLKYVDITGGEPLLHRDFELIISMLDHRRCRIIVNTNGLADLKKYSQLWKMRNLGVRFSLDGIGEVHDRIRGVKGCYESVIRNIGFLKSVGFHNIGISSTFSDININQALDLYVLSRRLGVDYTFVATGNSDIYYNKSDNCITDVEEFTNRIKKIVGKELLTFNIKRLSKAVYLIELCEFLKGNIKNIRCPAAKRFFFMRPSGEIYACNMRELYLGNLNAASFEDIWFSDTAEKSRLAAENCAVPCWTMCNAKSIMQDSKLKYMLRFVKNFIGQK